MKINLLLKYLHDFFVFTYFYMLFHTRMSDRLHNLQDKMPVGVKLVSLPGIFRKQTANMILKFNIIGNV